MSTFESSCIFNRNIFHNMPNMLMKILPNCKNIGYCKSMPYRRHASEIIFRYSEYRNGTWIRIIMFKGNKK